METGINTAVNAIGTLGQETSTLIGVAAATAAGKQAAKRLGKRTLTTLVFWSFMVVILYAILWGVMKMTPCMKQGFMAFNCFAFVGVAIIFWLICCVGIQMFIIRRLPDVEAENAKALQLLIHEKFHDITDRIDASTTLVLRETQAAINDNMVMHGAYNSNSPIPRGQLQRQIHSEPTHMGVAGTAIVEAEVTKAINKLVAERSTESQEGGRYNLYDKLRIQLEGCIRATGIPKEDIFSRLKNTEYYDIRHWQRGPKLKECPWYHTLELTFQSIHSIQAAQLITIAIEQIHASSLPGARRVWFQELRKSLSKGTINRKRLQDFKSVSLAVEFLRVLYHVSEEVLTVAFNSMTNDAIQAPRNPFLVQQEVDEQADLREVRLNMGLGAPEVNPFIEQARGAQPNVGGGGGPGVPVATVNPFIEQRSPVSRSPANSGAEETFAERIRAVSQDGSRIGGNN
eukprot:CAMPEP_0197861238 /NCGR_PEP_ID=MMETSP1438-20131217/37149_1 /TAXON_ID=1461541 /ORGANISM="Pterosperma sp., Strain CCMP1384" /LENGTH=456 /DNA_ID=CAMNT_0043478345 /DNA_START=36 /DNA_END=1406 /DNA_ORIENTATION=-